MALGPGETVGGYRLLGLIGEGGMGLVWEAEQVSLGRRVALKLVRSDLAGNPDFRRRFEDEARRAAAVEHPNVVTVFDSGEVGDQLFLSMSLVEGPDLRELLNVEPRIEPGRAVAIVRDVAEGLGAAHRGGLVHRDVKPSNILLGIELERALITDFGIAKALDEAGDTTTGMLVGTLRYMAPEQIQGQGADARSDVYALGIVLHEMLTGTSPMGRDTPSATMWAQVHDAPPKASLTEGVPPELDEVLLKALEKDPERRYATPQGLASAAAQALGFESEAAMAPVIDARTRLIPHGVAATQIKPRLGASEPKRRFDREGPETPATPAASPAPNAATGTGRTGRRLAIGAAVLAAGCLVGAFAAVAAPKLLEKETTTAVSVSTTTTSTVSTTTSTATETATTDSTMAATGASGGSVDMVTTSDEGYTAEVPAGWSRELNWYDGKKSGTRYKWFNPDDRRVWVLIETTPGESGSDLASATAVSKSLSNATVEPISLDNDYNSAVIRFTREGSRFDDYFTSPCSTGVAVEGSAPIGIFEDWKQVFFDVANSVRC